MTGQGVLGGGDPSMGEPSPPTVAGEAVFVDAYDLARVLHDAALFCDTSKDAAGSYRASVELTVSGGVMHACAIDGYVSGWSRAEVEFGTGDGRAVIDVIDVRKVVLAVTPRPRGDDLEVPHVIALTFHGPSLAVSMVRTDDDTEPDWSIDLRPPIAVDLFGQIDFPDVPRLLSSGRRGPSDEGAGEWAVSARMLAPFLKVTAAKGAVCEVEMLPPGTASSTVRLARVRIGELFTGAFTTASALPEPIAGVSSDAPPIPAAVRARSTEDAYRRPDVPT